MKKPNAGLAVSAIDASPYLRVIETKTKDILGAFQAIRRGRLALVKQFKEGHFNSRVNLIKPGELHAVRRLEGISHYLYFATIPQSDTQIDDAMERGKVRSKAKDSFIATKAALYYGAKHDRFRCVGKASNGERLWVRA